MIDRSIDPCIIWGPRDARFAVTAYCDYVREMANHRSIECLRIVAAFQGTGVYYDEPDLEVKYADKPEQLASIKKFGSRIFHQSKQVWQYEDIIYESSREDYIPIRNPLKAFKVEYPQGRYKINPSICC